MKTILITGASKGIGKELATVFASENYNVVINYNTSEKSALELLKSLNDKGLSAIAIKADITKEVEVCNMVKVAIEKFGAIDVLINNAAISSFSLFTDITLSSWNNIFDVNVNGTFNVTKAVLPEMINKKRGNIINISSIWGITGASCEVHYSATKGAIIALTKALAKELGPSNINVNCIAPGVISTEMNKSLSEDDINSIKNETPLGKIGSPLDIANLALFLASDKADFITGQIISSNGGIVI